MNLEMKLTIPEQVIFRQMGDEMVLLDLESGLYFGVDGVGQRIWETFVEGRNLEEARQRLASLLRTGLQVPKRRKATKPTRASKRKRLDAKRKRGDLKRSRRPDAD